MADAACVSVDEDLAGATRDLQLEGIVAKRLDAPYQPTGRRGQSPSRRSRIRRVQPVVEVDIDYHGRLGGPLRDAVLRTVAWAERPATATS
jgi:hypothetical protein